MMKSLVGASLLTLAITIPAHAGFQPWTQFTGNEDGDETSMFLANTKNGGDTITFGSISGNGSHFKNDITITSTDLFTSASGNATIKPVTGNLENLTLTPATNVQVDGMFFRGQFDTNTTGTIELTVTGNLGTVQTFTWDINSLTGGSDRDFKVIGFDETNEKTAEAISSVLIDFTGGLSTLGFKEFKQVDWSGCGDLGCITKDPTIGGVPEPSTWAMMGLGFAALGFAGYRARRSAVAAAI